MAHEIEAMYHMSQMMSAQAAHAAAAHAAAAGAPPPQHGHPPPQGFIPRPPVEAEMHHRMAQQRAAMEFKHHMMKYGPGGPPVGGKPPDERTMPQPGHLHQHHPSHPAGPGTHPHASLSVHQPPHIPPSRSDRAKGPHHPSPHSTLAPHTNPHDRVSSDNAGRSILPDQQFPPPHHAERDRLAPGLQMPPDRRLPPVHYEMQMQSEYERRSRPPSHGERHPPQECLTGGPPPGFQNPPHGTTHHPIMRPEQRHQPLDPRLQPMSEGPHGIQPVVDRIGHHQTQLNRIENRHSNSNIHQGLERRSPVQRPVDDRRLPPSSRAGAPAQPPFVPRHLQRDPREVSHLERGRSGGNLPSIDSRQISPHQRRESSPMENRILHAHPAESRIMVNQEGRAQQPRQTPPHPTTMHGPPPVKNPHSTNTSRQFEHERNSSAEGVRPSRQVEDRHFRGDREQIVPHRDQTYISHRSMDGPREKYSERMIEKEPHLERVPAPVPYKMLETETEYQPRREARMEFTDNPNKRKSPEGGSEQPLDLTVKKSKPEVVCTNPFEMEYPQPKPKVAPPSYAGGQTRNPEFSQSSTYSRSIPPATGVEPHSSHHYNQPHIPEDGPGKEPYRSRSNPRQSHPAVEYSSVQSSNKNTWSNNDRQPVARNSKYDYQQNVNTQIQRSDISLSYERHSEKDPTHQSTQQILARPPSPLHTNQKSSHPNETYHSISQKCNASEEQSQRPESNSRQTSRSGTHRSDSESGVPRNHYRPPSMLQYQRRSSWGSSGSFSNSFERESSRDGNRQAEPPIAEDKEPHSQSREIAQNIERKSQAPIEVDQTPLVRASNRSYHAPHLPDTMSIHSAERYHEREFSPAKRSQSTPSPRRSSHSPATQRRDEKNSEPSAVSVHNQESAITARNQIQLQDQGYRDQNSHIEEGQRKHSPHQRHYSPGQSKREQYQGQNVTPEPPTLKYKDARRDSQEQQMVVPKSDAKQTNTAQHPRHIPYSSAPEGYDKYKQLRYEQKAAALAAQHSPPNNRPALHDSGAPNEQRQQKPYMYDHQRIVHEPKRPSSTNSSLDSYKTSATSESIQSSHKDKSQRMDIKHRDFKHGRDGLKGKGLVDDTSRLLSMPYYPTGLQHKMDKVDGEIGYSSEADKAKVLEIEKQRADWLAAHKDIVAHFTDEQSLELLKKKFPDFPDDLPKNSESFRKLPNGVRFHRTEDLPGSREAVTRSLPVANVNPIIKSADGQDMGANKMSVSDIIAAKISEGLQPPPSNQQSIQDPGNTSRPKPTDKVEDDPSKNWGGNVSDIASLFFPFGMFKKKEEETDSNPQVDTNKKAGSKRNLASYIENAITKNLMMETASERKLTRSDAVDKVDLTQDDTPIDSPASFVNKTDEKNIVGASKPAASPALVASASSSASRAPTPLLASPVPSSSRCTTPQNEKPKPSESKPFCNKPMSRKHYFLHRHLYENSSQDSPEPPNLQDETKSFDASENNDKGKKLLITEKVEDCSSKANDESNSCSANKNKDDDTEDKSEALEENVGHDLKFDKNTDEDFKHDINIPKYPDSDTNDTWPAKYPSMSPLSSRTASPAPLTPQTLTTEKTEVKDEGQDNQPKNDMGRRRGRGRGRGRRGGRGRPPKNRQAPLSGDDRDSSASSVQQPKNVKGGLGQGTSKSGTGFVPGMSKQGFCPSKTKLLKRLASRDGGKEARSGSRAVDRGGKRSRRTRRLHSAESEDRKVPQTRLSRRMGSKRRGGRKRASSPARLKSVLRNKRKRISYNKNAAYEEAVRKEEERKLKHLQHRAKELAKEQKKKQKELEEEGFSLDQLEDHEQEDDDDDTEIDEESAAFQNNELEAESSSSKKHRDNLFSKFNFTDSRDNSKERSTRSKDASYDRLSQGNLEKASNSGLSDTSSKASDTPAHIVSSISRESSPEKKRLVCSRETGETALHKAARKGYLELVQQELESGNAGINCKDNAGYTPLHEACINGFTHIAKFLLEKGADVKSFSYDGTRPIHDALVGNHVEVVHLLLQYGADPTIAMYSGKTPLDLAKTPEMRAFLKGYLVDLNGTKERKTHIVMNEDGEEEEVLEEDFSHEIPWSKPPPFSKNDSMSSGNDAYKDLPNESTFPDVVPEFELFENPPIPLFNLHTDINQGWRNFHLLSDVTRKVGMTEEDFLLLHGDLHFISFSLDEILYLVEMSGNQYSKQLVSYLHAYCHKKQVQVVELDDALRQVLDTEVESHANTNFVKIREMEWRNYCAWMEKNERNKEARKSSCVAQQSTRKPHDVKLAVSGSDNIGSHGNSEINKCTADNNSAHCSAIYKGNTTTEKTDFVETNVYDIESIDSPHEFLEKGRDLKESDKGTDGRHLWRVKHKKTGEGQRQTKKESAQESPQEKYSPPATRRVHAQKQQPYSFRHTNNTNSSTNKRMPTQIESRHRDHSTKTNKRVYQGINQSLSSNPGSRKPAVDTTIAVTKPDDQRSSRSRKGSDSDKSEDSFCKASPSRSKKHIVTTERVSAPNAEKNISWLEVKLKSCRLARKIEFDEKVKETCETKGVFAIKLYLKSWMKKKPANRNKRIKVKGYKRLDLNVIDDRVRQCFVSLKREERSKMTVKSNSDQNTPDVQTEDVNQNIFELRNSVLEKVVAKFCKQMHMKAVIWHASKCGETTSVVRAGSSEEPTSPLQDRRSRASKEVRSTRSSAVAQRKRGEEVIPVLERAREGEKDSPPDPEMPNLTCETSD